MLTSQTFNALTVLRAMLSGYAVEILGDRYAYDEETGRIGVLSRKGEENFIIFADIDLNRFLSMCEQVDPEKIGEMLALLQHTAHATAPKAEEAKGMFH